MESMVALRRYVVKLKQNECLACTAGQTPREFCKTRQTGESMDALCRQGVMCMRVAITTLQRTNTVP